ncbi:DnaJ domain-containing protein [Paludisphaera sp.]|uniref:DnaJ domain-containing protein n=1 Tax=Paludisphaera sp. TaxID=2017432 RepID=UPI00301B8804
MMLMAEAQDGRTIWVVVELHRPKKRIRSRIVLHLGEFRDRDEAEAAFLERLGTDPRLVELAARWKANAADVLSDRKARRRFLLCGVIAGVSEHADDILRRREREEEQDRARRRAADWAESGGGPAAFAVLGLPLAASLDDIKAAYRRAAIRAHPDRGGDHAVMVRLNAAYEAAVDYASWRG